MASQEQYRLKQENIAAILGVLRRGDVTRRELCAALGLSWACVSDLVNELIGQGLLTEEKADGGAAGRRPLVLSLARDKRMLGVDINRIGITVCLCDLYGEKAEQTTYPICAADQTAWQASVDAALADVPASVLGIGVAMQGQRQGNTWYFPGDADVIEWSAKRLCGRPTWIEHDPNCLLLGYAQRPEERTMLVRVDTGIGVSLFTNGRFSQEPLELGQTVMDGERLMVRVCRNEAAALGQALGNLCALIRVDEMVLCGQRMAQLDETVLAQAYAQTVMPANKSRLRIAPLTDAAYGAARLALLRYPKEDRI